MTLLEIALAVGYGLVGFLVGCRVAAFAAYHMLDHWNGLDFKVQLYGRRSTPTGEHWFWSALWGIGAACIWPLVLVAVMGRGFLFRPPEHVRAREQQKRIEALERELDQELGTP